MKDNYQRYNCDKPSNRRRWLTFAAALGLACAAIYGFSQLAQNNEVEEKQELDMAVNNEELFKQMETDEQKIINLDEIKAETNYNRLCCSAASYTTCDAKDGDGYEFKIVYDPPVHWTSGTQAIPENIGWNVIQMSKKIIIRVRMVAEPLIMHQGGNSNAYISRTIKTKYGTTAKNYNSQAEAKVTADVAGSAGFMSFKGTSTIRARSAFTSMSNESYEQHEETQTFRYSGEKPFYLSQATIVVSTLDEKTRKLYSKALISDSKPIDINQDKRRTIQFRYTYGADEWGKVNASPPGMKDNHIYTYATDWH